VVTGETGCRAMAHGDPAARLLDAERETGAVAVEVLGAGEIKDVRPQGWKRRSKRVGADP